MTPVLISFCEPWYGLKLLLVNACKKCSVSIGPVQYRESEDVQSILGEP